MRAGIVGGKRALTAALRSVVIELANVHLDAEHNTDLLFSRKLPPGLSLDLFYVFLS